MGVLFIVYFIYKGLDDDDVSLLASRRSRTNVVHITEEQTASLAQEEDLTISEKLLLESASEKENATEAVTKVPSLSPVAMVTHCYCNSFIVLLKLVTFSPVTTCKPCSILSPLISCKSSNYSSDCPCLLS